MLDVIADKRTNILILPDEFIQNDKDGNFVTLTSGETRRLKPLRDRIYNPHAWLPGSCDCMDLATPTAISNRGARTCVGLSSKNCC